MSNSISVTVNSQIAATATLTNATCNNSNNGAINIVVSGGAGNKSYQWSNGASSQNISGISSGSYTVTITDALNCSRVYSYTVGHLHTLPATPPAGVRSCQCLQRELCIFR